MAVDVPGLLKGIAFYGGRGFRQGFQATDIFQAPDAEPVSENFLYFPDLVGIVGGEYHCFHVSAG